MTFNQAIQKAKENNIPHEYQKEMVESNFFTDQALIEFKNDFIFMVEALSK